MASISHEAANMKAVDIKNGTGSADDLFIAETPKPKPEGAQAIVKIKAFGLNRMDLLQREGQYPVPPQAPKTLGVEFSGTIDQVAAEGESTFKAGDEVFGLAYGGAYAEYIAVSTHMLIHKPEDMSWVEAAAIPETWITATQAMYLVGGFAAGIQLARADGASAVYVTAGSDEKIKFCVESLGATTGFNYRSQDWSKEILAATGGRGVDIIIDFIGQSYFQGNLNTAARDGRVVLLGLMSGLKLPEGVDIGPLLFKRLRVEGSTLRSQDEEYQRRLRDTLEEHALPKFKDGTFKVPIEKVFPWEKITEAHKLMESNQTKGKIVCTIG